MMRERAIVLVAVVVVLVLVFFASDAVLADDRSTPLRRAKAGGGYGFRKGSADRFAHQFGKRRWKTIGYNGPSKDTLIQFARGNCTVGLPATSNKVIIRMDI